jgi:TRAP-type uncharacterized transport system fused permease subunit
LLNVIETIVSSAIGICAFAGMMQGYWLKKTNIVDRVLLGIAALCLFVPNILSDLLGLVLLGCVTFMHLKKREEIQIAA